MAVTKDEDAMVAPDPVYVFACVRNGRINPYWIRAQAKQIRDEPAWRHAKKNGWRVCKVKVSVV